MTQAIPYTRSTGFADDERNNAGGRSSVRTAQVDAELDAIAVPLDLTISNLALLQRDDGVMRDGVVPISALGADTLKLLTTYGSTPRGAWLTAIVYAPKDLVTQSGNTYICVLAHTSGVFATDLSAGKWILFQIGANPTAGSIPFSPTVNTTSTNVQAAIVEVDADLRAFTTSAVDTAIAGEVASLASSANGSGADLIGGVGRVVVNVAALKALAKTGVGKAFVLGYYAAGDGGGGQYFYDASDTTSADNGGTIFVAADNGRWKLATAAPLHVRQFGAKCDLVTNDIAKYQAAHDAIAAAGGGTLRVSQAKLNATFNWDANKVVIEGDGGVWDFSSLGAGLFAINVIQSEPDVNARPRKNMAHSCRSVLILGPTGATTVYGINITDTVSTSVCGVIFEKGGIAGFIADVTFGAGSFFTTFRDFDFGNDSAGRRSQRNWVNAASSNSGERNVFDNVRFGIVTIENFNQSNGNADTVLDHCSFNTNSLRNGTLSGGSLKVLNTHVEWTGNTDVRIELIAGGNPQLIIDNPTVVPGAGQTTFGFLKVDPAIQTTCAVIANPMVTSSSPITVPWDDGGGRVIVTNPMRYASTGYMYGPSAGQNELAYGDFESAAFTTEFTLAGAALPATSATHKKQGTQSLKFTCAVGQSNTAKVSIPCGVGETLSYSFWYRGDGLTGTGTGFFANMYYVDAGGTNFLTTIPNIFNIVVDTPANAPTDNFVQCTIIASLPPAPPGTKTAMIQFFMQGTTSGTPIGYIDVVRMVAK